jgi:hypothetical protein
MNKYKVTKTATIKKEKKKCAVCDKKVYSKSRTFAYEIENELLTLFEMVLGQRVTTHCCSEECVTTYVLQHVDDPIRDSSFDKFVFPMIRAVYPNLISQQLVNVQPMPSINFTKIVKKVK